MVSVVKAETILKAAGTWVAQEDSLFLYPKKFTNTLNKALDLHESWHRGRRGAQNNVI